MHGVCVVGLLWIWPRKFEGGNGIVQCLKSSSVGSFHVEILRSALPFAELLNLFLTF